MPFVILEQSARMPRSHDLVVEWVDKDDQRWLISIDMKVIGGVRGCSAIGITAASDGYLLNQSVLRQIPLADIERAAFNVEAPLKPSERRGPRSGTARTDADLREVADVYINARNRRQPVQAAVADHFEIALSTAAKRIAAARRHGLIDPNTPPK